MEIYTFLGKCPQGRVLQFVALVQCIVLFLTCLGPHSSEAAPMALTQFLGKWLEVKKVGFEHLADVLGLVGEKRTFFEHSKSELTYSKDGDNWLIKVGIVGVPNVTSYKFKLGEPYSSQNIDGTPLKSVVRQEGSRFVERHESEGPKQFVMNIVKEVAGDTMTAKTTIDGVTMEVLFNRA